MNYTYHVITAMNRFENLAASTAHLREFGVRWHLVMDDSPQAHEAMREVESWITPWFCPPAPEKWFKAAWPIYWHGCIARFSSQDRCLILTDDDWYEPGFFEKLDPIGGEVLVVSMKRGHHDTPNPGYGTSTLVAAVDNLHYGQVAGEQLVVRGDIYSRHRHGAHADSDWELISAITAEHKPVFVPDAFVWFNYLEPGRWDKLFFASNALQA